MKCRDRLHALDKGGKTKVKHAGKYLGKEYSSEEAEERTKRTGKGEPPLGLRCGEKGGRRRIKKGKKASRGRDVDDRDGKSCSGC